MKIRPEIIEQIEQSHELIGVLMGVFDKGERTVISYLRDNDDELTKIKVLKILSEKLGVEESELLYEDVKV